MNKINILLFFLLTFGLSFSQNELSKEEKERRQKNIEAGNPFAKFGYKAKVATLSNGKYLEFHDLDSIVTIGSIRFHVDKMQIVGLIERDSLDPDAQPIGDATGRWISVDPLSEEFPEWSPYTMSYNNPIRFVDPDGRAAFDWRNSQGQLVYDPNADGGKGAYTEHASKNDKKIGDALQATATGKEQFNKLVTSAQPTEIIVDNGKGSEGEAGKTKNTGVAVAVDMATGKIEDVVVGKSTITLYMGTIGELADAEKNGNVGKLNGTSVDGLNFTQIVGAVVGHEIEHTTTANIIIQQSPNATQNQIEAEPTAVSNNIIIESRGQ
jgi:hypothetical protein